MARYIRLAAPAAALLLAAALLFPGPVSHALSLRSDGSSAAAETAESAARGGYFLCPDGLFRPEDPLTLGDAAAALENALGGSFADGGDADETMTEQSLAAYLEGFFPPERVSAAVNAVKYLGSSTVTRAEAAVCFNVLLGLAGEDTGEYGFPDVAPGYWARADILTAASTSAWDGGRPESGSRLIDGALYYVGADGYFLKNQFVGSLLFDANGKHTSGSAQLDGYVEDVLAAITDEGMTREEMLYEAYLYVRDSFRYLPRRYYRIGDVGWELTEATTMFYYRSGNCYCYAAAFWALARGLGYDAKAVSGTTNEDNPHGWVEMYVDGVRITYDVEMEMMERNDPRMPQDNFFAISDSERSRQRYIQRETDNFLPREANEGVRPG